MTALPDTFLRAGRQGLDVMSTHLLELARQPEDRGLLAGLRDALSELRRSSGAFAGLRALVQAAQAGEDLLDGLCTEGTRFDPGHTDALFECLDLIARMLDCAADGSALGDEFTLAADASVTRLRELLARQLLAPEPPPPVPARSRAAAVDLLSTGLPGAGTVGTPAAPSAGASAGPATAPDAPAWLNALPADVLAHARNKVGAHAILNAVRYEPTPTCFYQGEDPLFRIRRVPGLAGLHTETVSAWPDCTEFDPYRSNLRFVLLSSADTETLRDHFAGVEGSIEVYAPRSNVPALAADEGVALDFSRRQSDRPPVADARPAPVRPATPGGSHPAPAHPASTLRIRHVRSAGQSFGLPVDEVLDDLRLPPSHIHAIKGQLTAALPDRLIPLYALNALLGIPLEQQRDAADSVQVLVLRVGDEQVGLAVDAVAESRTVVPQPVDGRLADVAGYCGTARLDDSSLLILLNLRELL